jgi:ferrous iron transport protein B
LVREYPRAAEAAARERARLAAPVERLLSRSRADWARGVVFRTARIQGRRPGSFAERMAALGRHPVWGLPILGALLAAAYFLVMYASVDLAGWLDDTFAAPAVAWIAGRVPSALAREFLVGDFGILTLGLFNALCTVLPTCRVLPVLRVNGIPLPAQSDRPFRRALGRIVFPAVSCCQDSGVRL